MPRFLGQVTVERSAGRDRNGDPLGVTVHSQGGCGWAPRVSSEQHDDGRDVVIVGLTLYAPVDADILPTDALVLPDGSRWEVDGEVGRWVSPFTGWAPGSEMALRRVGAG